MSPREDQLALLKSFVENESNSESNSDNSDGSDSGSEDEEEELKKRKEFELTGARRAMEEHKIPPWAVPFWQKSAKAIKKWSEKDFRSKKSTKNLKSRLHNLQSDLSSEADDHFDFDPETEESDDRWEKDNKKLSKEELKKKRIVLKKAFKVKYRFPAPEILDPLFLILPVLNSHKPIDEQASSGIISYWDLLPMKLSKADMKPGDLLHPWVIDALERMAPNGNRQLVRRSKQQSDPDYLSPEQQVDAYISTNITLDREKCKKILHDSDFLSSKMQNGNIHGDIVAWTKSGTGCHVIVNQGTAKTPFHVVILASTLGKKMRETLERDDVPRIVNKEIFESKDREPISLRDITDIPYYAKKGEGKGCREYWCIEYRKERKGDVVREWLNKQMMQTVLGDNNKNWMQRTRLNKEAKALAMRFCRENNLNPDDSEPLTGKDLARFPWLGSVTEVTNLLENLLLDDKKVPLLEDKETAKKKKKKMRSKNEQEADVMDMDSPSEAEASSRKRS